MADVFLSYSRQDRDLAAALAAALQSAGLSVWWDHHIVAGETFDQAIETQLQAAGSVVVLWTPASVGSEWVRNEASEAAQRGVLVPALHGLHERSIPLEFRRRQTARLTGWPDGAAGQAGFDQLLAGVRRVLAQAPRPAAPAAPATVRPVPKAAPKAAPMAAPTAATAPGQPPAAPRRAVPAWVWLLGLAAATLGGGWAVWQSRTPRLAAARTASAPAVQPAAPGQGGSNNTSPSSTAVTRPAPQQDLAAQVAGVYDGAIVADSKGPSRNGVTVTLTRLDADHLRVSSAEPRIGTLELRVARDDTTVRNDGGPHLLAVALDKTPLQLALNPRDMELSYTGNRR